MKILLEILFTFMQIGLLSFGGGYASIGLVERQVVEVKHWMTYAEFADVITIDELTPGPIAINIATFVGTKVAGVAGAIIATFGNILPSFIIAMIMVKLYARYKNMKGVEGALNGLKSMVVAMISSTTISLIMTALFHGLGISIENFDYVAVILFAVALFMLRKYKTSPIIIMLGCGLAGLIIYPIIGL